MHCFWNKVGGAIKLIFASQEKKNRKIPLFQGCLPASCSARWIRSQLRPRCPACLEPHGGHPGSGQKLPWCQYPPWDKLFKMGLSWPRSHSKVPRATSAQKNSSSRTLWVFEVEPQPWFVRGTSLPPFSRLSAEGCRQLPFHPTREDRQMSHSTGLDQRSIIVLAEMDLFYDLFLDALQINMLFPPDRQVP